MVDKKNKNTANESNKKIIAIIAAIIVIIILLFSLVSCNKKTTNKDTKERKVIEEKDKKKKDEDKEKSDELTTVEEVEESDIVCVRPRTRYVYNILTPTATPSNTSINPSIPAKSEKYNSEIQLNGDSEIKIEWKKDEYNEEGAKYVNIKNNTIVSMGNVEDITIYKDGEKVDSIDNTVIGEYKVIYTYTNTNPANNVTVTKTRTVIVEDTTAPEVDAATGYVENGQYVVTISEPSETLSDWDETNTKVFEEKQDTVTITDVNGNTNEVEVAYETNKPEITGTKSETSSYQATYTFTVTDESDIAEVKVGDTVLDVTNNYEYTVYGNATYTVTATDALGNVGTYEVTVEGVKDLALTQNEVTSAVTEGATQHTNWSTVYKKNITVNNTQDSDGAEIKVVAMKYVSFATRQLGITTSSFNNNYINLAQVHTADPSTGFTAERNIIDITKNRYYYVYYEVEKTYPGKTPVKQAYVRLVDVN